MKDKEKDEPEGQAQRTAVETKVALDALAVYVNDKSPLQEISIPELAKIYLGEIKNWKDVGGEAARDRRSTVARTTRAPTATSRSTCSRTRTSRRETQTLAGTSAVVNAVKGDESASATAASRTSKAFSALKVKKDDTSPAVAPSLQTAQDGTLSDQPLPLFLHGGRADRNVKKFIDWVKGPEGQKVIGDVGYYPLPKEMITVHDQAWADRTRAEWLTGALNAPQAMAHPPVEGRLRKDGRVEASSCEIVALRASIASIVLILVFVAKEALPIFTSSEVRRGSDAQHDGRAADYRQTARSSTCGSRSATSPSTTSFRCWSARSRSTLVALLIAAPLSVAAAMLRLGVCAKARARDHQAGRSSSWPVYRRWSSASSRSIVWRLDSAHVRNRAPAERAGRRRSGCRWRSAPSSSPCAEDALRAVPDFVSNCRAGARLGRCQMIGRVVSPAADAGDVGRDRARLRSSDRRDDDRRIGYSGNAAWFPAVHRRTRRARSPRPSPQELGEVVVGSPHYHVLFALGRSAIYQSPSCSMLAGERDDLRRCAGNCGMS